MKKIILFLLLFFFFVSCCKEEIDPIDPCEVYPDAPFGEPSYFSTFTQIGTEYRAVIYTYECLDGKFVTVAYYQNSQVLKDGNCWEEKITEHPDGICK